MQLRWGVAWGSASALPGAAQGCGAELRKGRTMVPRNGAARGRAGASHAAALRHSVGLRRGIACGCAKA